MGNSAAKTSVDRTVSDITPNQRDVFKTSSGAILRQISESLFSLIARMSSPPKMKNRQLVVASRSFSSNHTKTRSNMLPTPMKSMLQ
ncbi:MAG: hypothetical protein R3C09_22765 [Pirellulaceae bacterium]|jgi:hypothetical protein